MIRNFSHHLNLDGKAKVDLAANRTSLVHTASAGITFYLGKKETHADWYWERKDDKLDVVMARINTLESEIDEAKNSDAAVLNALTDAVADLSKVENHSAASIQVYNNIEARNRINSQYVNVYFDFDQSKISTGTISAINFLIQYMNKNPEAKVDVIGYADELSKSDYNSRLSEKRANNVAEMIVLSGIDANRLRVIFKGEDNSVPKESKLARQLVRRVVFKIN